jgi:hypothetical protein
MKRFEGKKLEVISFRRLNGEIGMHLNLKSELLPTLIQDAFVSTSYKDCVEYHYCNAENLLIEILEVNDHDQIEKCVIAGKKEHIESFLIADGNATPNNPINFKTINFPEELSYAISRMEFSIDEMIEKLTEAKNTIEDEA